MAERYAVASGNWSDVATWDGGASLPTTGDTVHAGGYTVTVDQSVTVSQLTTAAGATAPAGGVFNLTDGVVVTADVVSGTSTCVTGASTVSAEIVGNISGSDTTNNAAGLYWTSSGSLAVTGNVAPGQADRSNVYGIVANAGNLTITGDITSSAAASGTGPGSRHGVQLLTSAMLTVIGNVTGGGHDNHGIEANTTGAIAITGNITGGSTVGSYGLESTGSSVVTIVGDMTSNSSAAVFISQSTVIHSGDLISDATGIHPLVMDDTAFLINSTAEMSHQFRVDNSGTPGVARSLYTGGTDIGNPAESDVRSGTTFGPASEYTGSLAVPAAQYVSQGVSVDATVGTLTGAGTLAAGTAQGGTSTTIQLAASETFGDDILNGNIVKITDGTGAGQSRRITDYVGATDTATVHEAWITNPDATSVYEVVEGSHVTGISQAEVNQACDDAISDAALATAVSVAAVAAAVGALNDLSAADVNAACDTAISDAELATADNLATVDTVVDNIQLWTHRIATKEFGVISNAGTSAESFTLAELGITVTYAGLDSSGNRTGVTFS